jgi:isopenicillin N synthase-like dioxygenase
MSALSMEMRVSELSQVPVIDVGPLVRHTPLRARTAEQIGEACRDCGFFYIVGHEVDDVLCQELDALSRRFFAQDEPQKMEIAMSRGGRAWRGYFPVGRELTSGKPDRKEGIYFGARSSDARDLPLHTASCAQHLAARSAVVSVLFRSRVRRRDSTGGEPREGCLHR